MLLYLLKSTRVFVELSCITAACDQARQQGNIKTRNDRPSENHCVSLPDIVNVSWVEAKQVEWIESEQN